MTFEEIVAKAKMETRLERIPEDLKSRRQWVGWRKESRNGQDTKVPFCPNSPSRPASVTDPSTWGTYDESVNACEEGHCNGIGFVSTKDNPFCGIDLDKCRNPETSELEPWAQEIIEALKSYMGISPSGTGVPIIVKGKLPPKGRRKGRVEMYDERRYFCMTGQHLSETPPEIESRPEELTQVN